MGYYLNAHLAYGAPAPESWDPYEAEERLPAGGPLVFLMDGDYNWDPSSHTVILAVKGSTAGAFETAAEIELPEPDIRDVVNAGKLFKHLTGEKFEPKWWLVPSGG